MCFTAISTVRKYPGFVEYSAYQNSNHYNYSSNSDHDHCLSIVVLLLCNCLYISNVFVADAAVEHCYTALLPRPTANELNPLSGTETDALHALLLCAAASQAVVKAEQ